MIHSLESQSIDKNECMAVPFFSSLIFCSSLQILSFSGSALSLSTEEIAEYASLGPFDYKKQRVCVTRSIWLQKAKSFNLTLNQFNSIVSVMIIVSVHKP